MDLLIVICAIGVFFAIVALFGLFGKGAVNRKPLLIMLMISVFVSTISSVCYNTFSFKIQENALLEEFTKTAEYQNYNLQVAGYCLCEGGINSLGIEKPYLYYSFLSETTKINDMSKLSIKSSNGFFASPASMKTAESLIVFSYRPDKSETYDVYVNGVKQGSKAFHNESVNVWLFNLKTKQYVLLEYFAASPLPKKGTSTHLNKKQVMKSVEKFIR